jgi:glycosyltransferase involved in cell wall biosynthesis
MKRPTLSIVIPCLNEQTTISRAIKDAQKYAQQNFPKDHEIIVSDNGSTDKTPSILKRFKTVRVIQVPVRGYGAALHWGVTNAKGEYVLFADADLSYPFSNLSKLKPFLKQNPDLLLGSRLKGNIQKGAMPFLHRYLGTPVLTLLIRWIYKIPTSDCNSGMRIVKRSFYKKLNMRNSGMEWASELLLKTALKKGKYIETPIDFKKDKRGKAPHLSTWADGWRHLKSIFLLKPSSLHFLLAIFPLLAAYFYPISFALTFLFLELTLVLILSLLTLDLLKAIIEKSENGVSKFLLQFKLVPYTVLACVLVGLVAIVVPDSKLGTKLFLVSSSCIVLMWIFLVETIKTHLANRLPDVQ